MDFNAKPFKFAGDSDGEPHTLQEEAQALLLKLEFGVASMRMTSLLSESGFILPFPALLCPTL